MNEVFQRLTTLEPAALGAEELTPEERPFLRFEPAAQEVFDAWRGDLEQTLHAEAEHPVWRSHVAKYRSLVPSLALIGHLIDGVAGGPTGCHPSSSVTGTPTTLVGRWTSGVKS